MKIIQSVLCFMAVFVIAGCSEFPINEEQYDRIIYLSRANIDLVKDEYVNYAQEKDTLYVSVSISGSHYPDKDIQITLQEEEGAIDKYNKENLSASAILNRHLPQSAYEYPQTNVTIKAGQATGLYPIYIYPEKLHCDSLYMLPFSIESVSSYEKRTKIDTVLLVRIKLLNEYSGDYYMNGTMKNLNTKSGAPYLIHRTLTATNGNTVRLFHDANENLDNLQSKTMTLTVNEQDHTVTMASWNKFELKEGGGTYLPDLQLYDIWYEYTQDGVDYRVEGFLYKIPKTELKQEDIDDWIRMEKDKRNPTT